MKHIVVQFNAIISTTGSIGGLKPQVVPGLSKTLCMQCVYIWSI